VLVSEHVPAEQGAAQKYVPSPLGTVAVAPICSVLQLVFPR
jgi:hypothetical protein